MAICLLLVAITWLGNGSMTRAEEWMSKSERMFFEALGVDAVVGAQKVRQGFDESRLESLARGAEKPLCDEVETILTAREKMQVSREEVAELNRLRRQAEAELRDRMPAALIGMFLGMTPLDLSLDLADSMLKQKGSVVSAWALQARWMQRALEARSEIDAALGRITDDFEGRTGTAGTAPDLSLRLVLDTRQVRIQGRAGPKPLKDPLVKIVLHPKPTEGKWVSLNLASAGLLRLMGVENMNFEAAQRGYHLAHAQERAQNTPTMFFYLLPDIRPGENIYLNLGLSLREAMLLDRIEVSLWSAEGCSVQKDLPGVADVQGRIVKAWEAEIRKRYAQSVNRARNDQAAQAIAGFIGQGFAQAQQRHTMNQQAIQQEIDRMRGAR